MEYNYVALPLQEPPVAGVDCRNEQIDRTNDTASEFPDALLNHAHRASWSFISLQDIGKENSYASAKHILLTESITSTQPTNFMFEQVRGLLPDNQYFAFKIITAENIKSSILEKHSSLFFFIYYPVHFLFRRVLPKLKGFRKVCRLLRVPADVSKAEIMGRLMYKGFELVDLVESNRETLLIIKRNPTSNPSFHLPPPNEGFLFRMKRMGQHAKPIQVYKLRSMHPYAEYVQAYLHTTQGLDAGGKFKNDFRVSTGGRVIRKYWLDELPMLYNLLKGDLKLVGVRPISEHYFSLYPVHAQVLRTRHKPGLLPPFYADLPQTFDEIVQSEINYLTAYEANPFQTDLRYFKRIITNIVINRARSK